MPLFPILVCIRRECKALVFSHGSGKHIGIVIFVDYKIPVFVMIEEGWSKLIEFEATAPLPILRFRYSTLFALNNFPQSWEAYSIGVITQFDTNPSAAHFVSDSRSGTASKETVKNNITRISC